MTAYRTALTTALLMLTLAAIAAPAIADDHGLRLRDAMSEAEFERSGLDKLSADELAVLEAWVTRRMIIGEGAFTAKSGDPDAPIPAPVAPTPAPAPAPAPAAPPAEPSPEAIAIAREQLERERAEQDYGKPGAEKDTPKTFRSRIDGQFNGWNGKTIFKLENGQVWQQRLDGRFTTTLNSPEVEITRGFLGLHKMRVFPSGRVIGVKRIE